MLLAPAVVVPLLTLILWARGDIKTVKEQKGLSHIDLDVPDAHVADTRGMDKMAFYKQADEDLVKQKEQIKKDSGTLYVFNDTNEIRVNKKLTELKEVLTSSPAPSAYSKEPTLPLLTGRRTTPPLPSTDMDRLERMLLLVKDGGNSANPEMAELNRALDKIIAVQHPDLSADTTRNKTEALPVSVAAAGAVVTGWPGHAEEKNRFYDLESSEQNETPTPASLIEALVPETQTLVDGGLLRLQLKTELVIRGQHIPSGTPLYGVARLADQRLQVKISAIRLGEQVFPVALQVIDLDGLAGIYEPGSPGRETIRESAGQGLTTIGPSSLATSLSGEAATAGIQLARSLAGRKVRLVRVSVKAGYHLLLQDMSQKQ
jgi:hypothetical protein